MRAVSLAEGTIALRCTACAQIRLQALGSPERKNQPPRLRLIVNR